jgi:hypothetical protein
LLIEKGVFFDGHCQMESSVTAVDPLPPPRHSGSKKLADKVADKVADKAADKSSGSSASTAGGSNSSST